MPAGTSLWLVAAVGLVLALGIGWPRRRRRRNALRAAVGLALLAVAAAAMVGGLLLREYHWLHAGEPIARLALRQLDSQSFEATLESAGRAPTKLPLHGDEWQLDARLVHWRIGALPPMVRLERLSGRYGDPKQDTTSPRDLHDLRARWDFWQFREHWLGALPIADSRWGSVTSLPMLDGATWVVFADQRGALVARPADAKTARLLQEAGW
jgi:hypothetical protein